MVSPIKVFIKFVCKLPFTFYFCSLIQFFNFRTKIPLHSRKTAIAQTPTPGPNGHCRHWPFCVTKVGMDVVPKMICQKQTFKQQHILQLPAAVARRAFEIRLGMLDIKMNYKNKCNPNLTRKICRTDDESLQHIFTYSYATVMPAR